MSLAPRRRQPSILLIGLRGSGKTYTGRLATRALGAPWRFIDADKLFEEKHGDLGSFVRTKGWEAFRTTEVKLLEELVERRGIEHVIALGGGVVESPAAREVLKSWAKGGGKVVYVERDLREVVDYGNKGLRVIALASKDDVSSDPLLKTASTTAEYSQLEQKLTLVGLVGMLDPPRPEVAGSIAATLGCASHSPALASLMPPVGQ